MKIINQLLDSFIGSVVLILIACMIVGIILLVFDYIRHTILVKNTKNIEKDENCRKSNGHASNMGARGIRSNVPYNRNCNAGNMVDRGIGKEQ